MERIELSKVLRMGNDKYNGKAIRWLDKGSHYELIFTDDFMTPASNRFFRDNVLMAPSVGDALLTDILLDMRAGCKDKEVHVFIGSFGGEVAALNMILQELLMYEYRVGINLGTACSCGWMLFFACQERYVTPYSQTMYHDISTICAGKHTELRQNAEFMARWQQELLKITDTGKVLTPKELDLGHTSEVWLTGQELIDRGAAHDYKMYQSRQIPTPIPVIMAAGELYAHTQDGWRKLIPVVDEPCSYADLVKAANDWNEQPSACAKKRKTQDRRGKSSRQSRTAVPEAPVQGSNE